MAVRTIKLPAMPAGKTKTPKAAPVVVEAKAPRVKVERIVHPVESAYAGPSKGLNVRKSRTALDLSIAGTNPDYMLSVRTETVAGQIKRLYGAKPFHRANFDAGIMKHLLMKGHIEIVSGDGKSEDDTFRFTPAGLKYKPQHVS